MTLGEFLNHIKHKSLNIEVDAMNLGTCHFRFKGTLGEYQTSVVKSEINDEKLIMVFPSEKTEGLDIYIKEE